MIQLLYKRNIVPLLLFSLFGCLVFYGAEMTHYSAQIWELDEVTFFWWIPVVYFFVFLFMGACFHLVERLFPPLNPTGRNIMIEVGLMGLAFSVPALLPKAEILAAGLLLAYCLIRLFVLRAKGDIWFFAFTVIIDYAVEMVLMAFNFYTYNYIKYTPLPLWSPFLFGGLGLGIRRLFQFYGITIIKS